MKEHLHVYVDAPFLCKQIDGHVFLYMNKMHDDLSPCIISFANSWIHSS